MIQQVKKAVIILLITFCLPFLVKAQVMVSATGKPTSLIICYGSGTFSLQIANTSGSTMSGATLLLDLPAGVRYIQGSVGGATELNITNLNQPVFTIPDIPNNSAHTVTYDAMLVCGYTNTENYNYIVTYNSTNYSGNDTPLQNYYFPEPVITNITNATAVIPVNTTITRDITIQQQGVNSTLDTLILLDEHTSDIQIMSVSLGTLHLYVGPGPLRVDTIIITGSDFPGVNMMFDAGETIIVSETVKLLGCTNGQSTLKACWGCYDQTCNFYASFPSVSPAAGTPSITMAFTNNNHGWGFIDNSGWIEFTITNNGTGAGTAFDLTALCGFSSGGSTYYPNSNWLNKIDSFSVNGNYLQSSYNYAAGALNGQYAYYTKFKFTSDPDGAGTGLDDLDGDGYFDDLPAGKSIIVKAHTYYDWTAAVSSIATGNTCGYGWTNSAWQGFRYGSDYKNQCHVQYGVNWIPNSNLNLFMTYDTKTIQITIPPDLYDATPVWFEHLVSTSTATTSDGCPNDSVFYKLILPKGVSIAPGTATYQGVSMGAPIISGDSVFYILSRTRVASGGLFRVPLQANCAVTHSPTASIHVELKFWCDKISYKSRFFTYWCANSPIFGIQCPTTGCTDPFISRFVVQRTTLGWTDNYLTARVTPTTPGLRLDHAMSLDSIRVDIAGKLNGSVDSLYFHLQHGTLPGGWGNRLFFDYLTDTLYFYDWETTTWHICPNVPVSVVNGTTSSLDAYFGNLTDIGNCLNGITFSQGDSIHFVVYGKIKNVTQYDWSIVPAFRARLAWKDVNSMKYCNDLGTTFSILGSKYNFAATTFYQQIVLSGCTSFSYEGIITASMESCGGDIAFPNEIRPFLVLDTMIFTLPEGFVYQAGSARHTYNVDNSYSYSTDVIPDPVISLNALGTKLTFIRNSSWHYSDYYDCSYDLDRITFTATPSCKATGDYTYTIDGRGRQQFYADGQGIHFTSTAVKSISYTAPLMALTPLITTAEGRVDTVVWQVRVCNSRAFAANNVWLAFENTNNGIQITDITDITIPGTPVPIPFSPYETGKTWSQLGTFSANACKIYRIRALYTNCTYDSVLVRQGYNCAGYPMNPELGYPPTGYQCTENDAYIYLDPKDITMNITVISPPNPVNLCDTIEYEATVTNSQLSYAYNLKLTVAIQPGTGIINNTSVFKFPYTTGSFIPISDPQNIPLGSNKWVYDISNDPNGVPLLKGVDSIPRNGYKLKFHALSDCNFTSGTSLKLTASGANSCGDEKTRTSYAQPILITGLPSNVNLYVLSTLNNDVFYTCGANSLVWVKVINLGPDSVSSIEKLGITIDDAYDYVANSLIGIHNPPTGLASDNVTGGIRYLNFTIPPNLHVNDSIVFTFELHDVDPGSLLCDTLQMETSTLLVGKVFCTLTAGDSCVIQSITASIITERPVLKDHIFFGSVRAMSVPSGTSGEIVTVRYSVRNSGTDTLNSQNATIVFIHDANGNGLPDENGADSLYSQTISVLHLLPGDSVTSTAVFTVPAGKVCGLLGALRLKDNVCSCNSDVIPVSNIHFFNAGNDTTACQQTPLQIGTQGTIGYGYIWIPATYLDSYIVPNPVFTYPDPVASPITLTYILNTTRAGNCFTKDTMQVTVLPHSTAEAGRDTLICEGSSVQIINSGATNYLSVLWTTAGTGTFDNPANLHPVYSPGQADILNGNVLLTMTVIGCGTAIDYMTVTIQPKPTSFAGKDTSICVQFTYLIKDALAGNSSHLKWSTTGDGVFSDTNVLHPVYTPGSADKTTGFVNLILTVSGIQPCGKVSDTMKLTFTPPPFISTTPLAKTICSNTSTNITLTANQTGTTFSWTAALITGNITGFSNGSGNTINQILINNGVIPGTVTYTIIPDNQGCIGTPVNYPILVNPLPSITTSPLSGSICSGNSTNINLQSSVSGTTFVWTATGSSPNVSGYSGGSGSTIIQTLFNSGWTNETVTYHITPSANGCTGISSDYVMTVHPVPDVYFNPPDQTICGSSACLINLLWHIAGATFSWTASGSSPNVSGYSPGNGNVISQTLFNSGYNIETVTYHVLPSANDCQGISGIVVIMVKPLANVSFTACRDIITTTIAQPFKLKGGLPLGGIYKGAGVDSLTGIFYPALAGIGTHTLTYSYTNMYSCRKQASLTETVVLPPPFTCGDSLTDVRTGKKYPSIHIGSQCWLAANLNYGTMIPGSISQRDNCIPEKYCLNDITANCELGTAYYQWDEVMQYDETLSTQGFCPPGWHIPSETDWNTLFAVYINNGFAAWPLLFTGYSGFNATLSGTRHLNKTWDFQGFATFFWSSTSHSVDKAWSHGMNGTDPSVSLYPAFRSNAFSVRCLQD